MTGCDRLGLRFLEWAVGTQQMERLKLITPTTNEEWDSYHRIRREVLFEARGHFGVYDPNRPDEKAPNKYPKLLVVSGEPVGVVRIDIDSRVAALRRVAIRADVQRLGHGRALLNLVEQFAREAGCTQLVSSVAPDAVGFYERFGFVAEERNVNERGPGDSVFMTRPIDPVGEDSR